MSSPTIQTMLGRFAGAGSAAGKASAAAISMAPKKTFMAHDHNGFRGSQTEQSRASEFNSLWPLRLCGCVLSLQTAIDNDPRTTDNEAMNEATNPTPPTPSNTTEQIIWEGSSSQVRNLHIYLLCALFCWLVVPIIYAIVKWIQLRCRRYEITTQRVRIRQGVFSKRTDELELYRVKDSIVLEPFWQRLFGVGNIVISTNDTTTPTITLEALPNARETREKLRSATEECRDRKRVRVAELE
jgi:membrane protein YdbS with pleckstrin-like domain